MRAALLALALLPSAVFATISITGPSPNQYWVQNTSNTIQWTYNQGDPTPVDIIITNQANQTLNGDFSIARFVPVSQEVWLALLLFLFFFFSPHALLQSFTVTHVTLRVGTGYQVVFVNPVDGSQVYANSSNFEVRTPGSAFPPMDSYHYCHLTLMCLQCSITCTHK
ncbi:hypothetical protein B0F90DRAFT_575031 [Multifurca ochricompacta]|uniref:Uncharacterized protein n=1 Tax=Multifurca ochricompacta TaxID=376703 RepID=A0AAD4QLU9_9AGAM|nr:hypothetical protein B0F90DRAFT_575031 [Multifurca ochricompacta]